MENLTNSMVLKGSWVYNTQLICRLLGIKRYVIGGSVALRLQGYPILRDIHDIDIMLSMADFKRIQEILVSSDKNGFLRAFSGYPFDKEIHELSIDINGMLVNFLGCTDLPAPRVKLGNLRILEAPRIIAYKQGFNRPKDREDIKVWENIGLIKPSKK